MPEPQAAAGVSDSASNGSYELLRRLGSQGPERDAALADLHALLVRAARFEISRRRQTFPHLGSSDLDDLAIQSADDALMSILRRLDDFRGQSRFTTWACKFAIVEAGAKVRRQAWRDREIPITSASWPVLADGGPSPHQHAEAHDLLGVLWEEIERQLTARQREVFVAITLAGVPIDVMAERLSTNRGALYKTLHDARRKLRAALAVRGLGIDGERRS